jgi:hypothetical protein
MSENPDNRGKSYGKLHRYERTADKFDCALFIAIVAVIAVMVWGLYLVLTTVPAGRW